jgi:heavy metal sensor kinase
METPENDELRRRGFSISILTPQAKVIQTFGPYNNLPLSPGQSFTTYKLPSNAATVRIYNQPVYDNNQLIAIVQVAQSLDDIHDTLERLLVTLLISMPILLAVAGGSGYYLASRALAPIDQITSTARRISAEDLSARLNMPVIDDEVGRLAQTFDEMLARLDDSFQRERQFTNDASHELRTPLTAMQAILGMIREKPRSPKEYEQALDDLKEEADRLRTLVENLLSLARGDKQMGMANERVDLSLLLKDVTDSLRPLADANQLELICEVPDNLSVFGDRDELIRLFVNILDNAIKFTERGEISVTAANSNDKKIITKIADTGKGISPQHLPHIFDRFYRADSARSLHGTGLGLAIAKQIVEVHHGTIEAAGIMGKGTTFTVTLPQNRE